MRIERIGGDCALVVERVGAVEDQRRRRLPCRAAIAGPAREHRAVRARRHHLAVESERDQVHDAVRCVGDPRIARARVVAAVRDGAAGAARERNRGAIPVQSAIHRETRDDRLRAAARPAVLLPDADEVGRVAGIDREEWFDLGVDVDRSGRWCSVATGRKRRCGGCEVCRIQRGRRWGWWRRRRLHHRVAAVRRSATAGDERRQARCQQRDLRRGDRHPHEHVSPQIPAHCTRLSRRCGGIHPAVAPIARFGSTLTPSRIGDLRILS